MKLDPASISVCRYRPRNCSQGTTGLLCRLVQPIARREELRPPNPDQFLLSATANQGYGLREFFRPLQEFYVAGGQLALQGPREAEPEPARGRGDPGQAFAGAASLWSGRVADELRNLRVLQRHDLETMKNATTPGAGQKCLTKAPVTMRCRSRRAR